MKKRYLLTALLLLFYCLPAIAQSFAINTDGSDANASALLDVKSITKGLLIPRMTLINRNVIAAPATGLMIYQTDNTPGFYYYDGTAWVIVISSTNNLWLQSGANIYNSNTGNVGIGTSTPLARLHVSDGAILFSNTVGTTPASGGGTRMMWIPAKGAFRAGSVIGNLWDDAYIGQNSMATGKDTQAPGDYSTAMGNSSIAEGVASVAIGASSKAFGTYSTAMGWNTMASGISSTTMGWSSIASGDYSTAIGRSTTASGISSTAIGRSTTASAIYSTAMGFNTIASGNSSNSMGFSTTASGFASTTMGSSTTASGDYSTAMGEDAAASAYASTAVGISLKSKSWAGFVTGLYNDSTNAASPTFMHSLNRVFQVGNGTADNARSNAMTILHNGNTGIGTTTPVALLQVKKGAVLFDSTVGATPVSGGGTRMMWIPAKAAFRAGAVLGAEWDEVNIGLRSFATGYASTASGDYSTATGSFSTASGDHSTSIGPFSFATGSASVALGFQNSSSGDNAISIGQRNFATGATSVALGYFTITNGVYSTSLGMQLRSKSYGGVVTGSYNDSTDAADANAFNNANRIFQIGNGTAENARHNAMTVLQGGNTGIGTTTPAALLHVKTGAVLFDSTIGTTPVSGAGTRMMWIPAKAAFRAGNVSSNQWDDANIGSSSIAMGYSTRATGDYSNAMGNGTTASGNTATAMGFLTTASGLYSTAMGYITYATGFRSTSIGFATRASGDYSTSMGEQTIASGNSSTATGAFVKAKSYSGFVAGIYNDSANAADAIAINSLNRIFQVGNGTADNARSNAMTILQNGSVGIGVTDPQQMLSVYDGMNIDQHDANNGTAVNGLRFGVFSGEAIGSKRTAGGNMWGLDFYTNSVNRMSITNGGAVQINNNLTVQSGKGIIRNTDGTQSKKLSTTVLVSTSFLAGETKTFAVTWSEAFGAAPEAFVGNVTGGAGGWAELVMTISGTSSTGATLYVYNPKTIGVSPNFNIKVVAIGAQ